MRRAGARTAWLLDDFLFDHRCIDLLRGVKPASARSCRLWWLRLRHRVPSCRFDDSLESATHAGLQTTGQATAACSSPIISAWLAARAK